MRTMVVLALLVAGCGEADKLSGECAPRSGMYRSDVTRLMGECASPISGGTFEPATEATAKQVDSCTTEYDNALAGGVRVRAQVRWSRDGLSAEGLQHVSEPGCESLWWLTYSKL